MIGFASRPPLITSIRSAHSCYRIAQFTHINYGLVLGFSGWLDSPTTKLACKRVGRNNGTKSGGQPLRETEEQFGRTLDLLRTVQFDVVHVACYSPRQGTVSASWEDDVPHEEKEERRRRVERLQEEIQAGLNARLQDQVAEILVEDSQSHRQDVPQWRGRTRTNKLVFIPRGDENLVGQLVPVRITKTSPWALQGVMAH